jgi:hypothetical protein
MRKAVEAAGYAAPAAETPTPPSSSLADFARPVLTVFGIVFGAMRRSPAWACAPGWMGGSSPYNALGLSLAAVGILPIGIKLSDVHGLIACSQGVCDPD